MMSQFSFFTAMVVVGVLAGPAPFDRRPIDASRQDEHGVHATAPPAGQSMHGMKMHEQMMADQKANSGRLDALVKEMNAASGAARTDAIAAVVNELVRQHVAMQAHMRGMCETKMSQHQTPVKP